MGFRFDFRSQFRNPWNVYNNTGQNDCKVSMDVRLSTNTWMKQKKHL